MSHRTARLLPLLVLGAVLGSWLVPAGAVAADAESGEFCSGADGVSIVVDFADLDERVERSCVPDAAGEPAAAVFESAGFELTPVESFPGAVCQVDGEPADVACSAMPPADAYWGLYVADADGAWDFAPVGADELELQDGDFVGFAWQGAAEPAPPSVEPVPGEAADESAEETDSSSEDADQDSESATGLPVWVVVAVLLVVVAVAALFFVRRARSRT